MARLIENDGRPPPGGSITPLVTTVGTSDGTIADVTGSFSQSVLNNNFKDLADQVNLLTTALRNAGIVA